MKEPILKSKYSIRHFIWITTALLVIIPAICYIKDGIIWDGVLWIIYFSIWIFAIIFSLLFYKSFKIYDEYLLITHPIFMWLIKDKIYCFKDITHLEIYDRGNFISIPNFYIEYLIETKTVKKRYYYIGLTGKSIKAISDFLVNKKVNVKFIREYT